MMDRECFCRIIEKNMNYARLIGKCFTLLSPAQQAEWLAWVDAGPEPSIRPYSMDNEADEKS